MNTNAYLFTRDRLTNIILKRKPHYDFFTYENIIQNYEQKYKKIFKSSYNNFDYTIEEGLLKDKINKLLKFIKKFPIGEKRIFGSEKIILAYGKEFEKEKIDFIEKQLKEGHLSIFCREIKYIGGYIDDYHKLFTYCKTENDRYLKQLFGKRKIKSLTVNDRFYIKNLIDFFRERLKNIEEEKILYLSKRFFKKQKKKVFIFNVKISGIKFELDYASIVKDEFPIIISHIGKEQAIKSLYYKYGKDDGQDLYDGLVKRFSAKGISQIYNVKIEKLNTTKENIQKALKYKKENFHLGKYFPYGKIFKDLKVGINYYSKYK